MPQRQILAIKKVHQTIQLHPTVLQSASATVTSAPSATKRHIKLRHSARTAAHNTTDVSKKLLNTHHVRPGAQINEVVTSRKDTLFIPSTILYQGLEKQSC